MKECSVIIQKLNNVEISQIKFNKPIDTTSIPNKARQTKIFEYQRKQLIYSEIYRRKKKNYMQNKRSIIENRIKEYEKYKVYFKKYSMNKSAMFQRRQYIRNKIRIYRTNKTYTELKNSKNNVSMKNLRRNQTFKKNERTKNKERMQYLRNNLRNNYKIREKSRDLIRIRLLRTDLKFKMNEYEKNKQYKIKTRKNLNCTRKKFALNFNKLRYSRINNEDYKMRAHKDNLMKIKYLNMTTLGKQQLYRLKNCAAVKLLRKQKQMYKKQHRVTKLIESLISTTNPNVIITETNDPYNLMNRPLFTKKLEHYLKAIQEGPTWICSCCGGLF